MHVGVGGRREVAYHWPTALNSGGRIGHTKSSVSASTAWHDSGAPTGTAAISRAGSAVRTARTAARIVAPVARPSSTTITTRPPSASGGRSGAEPCLLRHQLLLRCLDRAAHGLLRQPQLVDQVIVEHGQATGRHGTERQLALAGRADLADAEDVELAVDPIGDDGGDRNTAAWQPEDDRPRFPRDAALGGEPLGDQVGQDSPRFVAIPVPVRRRTHGTMETQPEPPRCRRPVVWSQMS